MNVLQTYESNKEFRLEVQSLEYLKTNLNYFMTFSNTCKHGLLVTPEINKEDYIYLDLFCQIIILFYLFLALFLIIHLAIFVLNLTQRDAQI